MLPAELDGQSAPEPVLAGHVPVRNTFQHWTDKEVVESGHDGLQFHPACPPTSYTTENKGTPAGLEVLDASSYEKELANQPDATTKRPLWQSRKALLAAAVALVLVIVAAVVGGVIGSRKSEGVTKGTQSSTSSSNSSPSNVTVDNTTPTTITTLNSIKQGSNLAVTAWRKGEGLQIFLYYQTQNGTFRSSTFDSTQASFTYNGSYWDNSTEVVMDSAADAPANGTSLATAMLLWDTTYAVSFWPCSTRRYDARRVYSLTDMAISPSPR